VGQGGKRNRRERLWREIGGTECGEERGGHGGERNRRDTVGRSMRGTGWGEE
jgi:hypothetical protein